MEIYVVIVEDRHCDTEADSAHLKASDAIKKAKHLAKKYCKYDEDYEETSFDKGHLLFSAQYSCESDQVSVVKTELIES